MEKLEPFLTCPICMDRMRKAALLNKCAHRFCVSCITQTLLTKQVCPCCNGPAHVEDIVHDHQFDGMSEMFAQIKEEYDKKQFETIIERTLSESDDQPGAGAGAHASQALTARILEVLRLRLRDTVAQFAALADHLQRKCEAAKDRLRDESSGALPAAAAAAEAKPATRDIDQKLATLDAVLAASMLSVAAALDRHLETALPRAAMLPVSVALFSPSLNVRVPTHILRPTDSCADIRAALMERAQQVGRKAVITDEAAVVELRTAFDAAPVLFEGGALPLMSAVIPAGAELALVAGVACAVELCFVDTFASNPGAIVDYFSCKECGVNWICASCAPACHQGHTVVPHLKGHKSEWACCYCARKCKCTLRKKT